MRLRLDVLGMILAAGLAGPAHADETARAAAVSALTSGALAKGVATLTPLAAAGDPDAQLGLGMIQFLQSVEHLSQGLYRYGLQPPRSFMLPIVRLPVPLNPAPEPVDYDKFRALLQQFVDDLTAAEATLAGVTGNDARIDVDLMQVHYDANGNGSIGGTERLAVVMAAVMEMDDEDIPSLMVGFDAADAYWLRGYANVLMALSEFMLAYDWRESFDVSFHVFFPRAHSAFQEALAAPSSSGFGSEVAIADLISFLHIRWQVEDADRMKRVREHLKQMTALSRLNWAAILAETDDNAEWVPGPGQTGATGALVSREQVEAWQLVLDELDALLDGTKLMPHWRFDQGINMRRVFDEPSAFDLVLWITGPSALPYLEDGTVLTSEEWEALTSSFEGQFGSYAIWFN